jgi:hypothetical protein
MAKAPGIEVTAAPVDPNRPPWSLLPALPLVCLDDDDDDNGASIVVFFLVVLSAVGESSIFPFSASIAVPASKSAPDVDAVSGRLSALSFFATLSSVMMLLKGILSRDYEHSPSPKIMCIICIRLYCSERIIGKMNRFVVEVRRFYSLTYNEGWLARHEKGLPILSCGLMEINSCLSLYMERQFFFATCKRELARVNTNRECIASTNIEIGRQWKQHRFDFCIEICG